jgi:hypothetical protein
MFHFASEEVRGVIGVSTCHGFVMVGCDGLVSFVYSPLQEIMQGESRRRQGTLDQLAFDRQKMEEEKAEAMANAMKDGLDISLFKDAKLADFNILCLLGQVCYVCIFVVLSCKIS